MMTSSSAPWICLALLLPAVTGFTAAAQAAGPDVQTPDLGATPMTRQHRQLWFQRSAGENLALGKPVKFSSIPAYRHTHDANDEYDLTDGRLSERRDDTIWHTKDGVCWQSEGIEGVQLMLDLGAVYPVDRVVIRLLGGKRWKTFAFPQEIVLVVSEDGHTCYAVASLHGLQPAEQAQDGQAGCFYLPESGEAYVYPFMFDKLRTKARYIGLRIKNATGGVTADELAVIQGNHAVDTVRFDSHRITPMFMSGVSLAPFHGVFSVAANILVPSSFRVSDLRDAGERAIPPAFVFDVPAGISLLETQGTVSRADILRDDKPYVRWTLAGKSRPPKRSSISEVYFRVDDPTGLRDGDRAYLFAQGPGCQTNETAWPIRVLTIPPVPAFTNFHVSLSWMEEKYAVGWPDFFTAWRHLGFNAVSTFPRNWREGRPSAAVDAWLTDARARGFKVIYNESPFHVMINKHREANEIRSSLPGGRFGDACPSYRGPYYREEIQRVRDLHLATKADFVFYDIECWGGGAREAGTCLRCQQGMRQSGKPLPEYLTDLGMEMLRDMHAGIRDGVAQAGLPMPVIGAYQVQAARDVYQGVFDFAKVYPAYLDVGMPSLYVKGQADVVQNNIRENFKRTGRRAVIPWLSAGTYGEFEPEKIEHCVLEALLNGAAGLTYYWFGDFDSPMDYYYHAKALNLVAPYEGLLQHGTLRDVPADNPALFYTAWGTDRELLLLVGNYTNHTATTGQFTLPLKGNVSTIREIRQGVDLPPAAQLSVTLPPLEIQLFHVQADETRSGPGAP